MGRPGHVARVIKQTTSRPSRVVPSQGERAVKAFHLVVKLKSPDEKDREKEVLDNKGSPPLLRVGARKLAEQVGSSSDRHARHAVFWTTARLSTVRERVEAFPRSTNLELFFDERSLGANMSRGWTFRNVLSGKC